MTRTPDVSACFIDVQFFVRTSDAFLYGITFAAEFIISDAQCQGIRRIFGGLFKIVTYLFDQPVCLADIHGLDDEPELINADAFENWIIKVQMSDKSELDGLMDAAAYQKAIG